MKLRNLLGDGNWLCAIGARYSTVVFNEFGNHMNLMNGIQMRRQAHFARRLVGFMSRRAHPNTRAETDRVRVARRRIVESAAIPRADILVPEASRMHGAARYVLLLFLAATIAAPLSKVTAAAPGHQRSSSSL